MKKPIILITDTMFVNHNQEDKLRQAGYEVERLSKLMAGESELKKALKNKVGYILGGIEKVTEPVIDSATFLRAIVFTGIDYNYYIHAAKKAQQKGILIESTPDGPTQPTAEWALAAVLLMNRRMQELGRPGTLRGITTTGLQNQRVGIIGFGRIGHKIAEMLMPFEPAVIQYYSHHIDNQSKVSFVPLKKLLSTSDIIFVCIPYMGNKNFLGDKELKLIKNNALIVSISATDTINNAVLYNQLLKGKLRMASSHSFGKKFEKLPLSNWYCSNDAFASNTFSGVERIGNLAVQKIIGLLGNKHGLLVQKS